MRAVTLQRQDGVVTLRLEDVPTPTPAAGEALIAVEVVGVNHLELLQLAGQAPAGAPDRVVPGIDAAGRVVALGPGADGTVAIGDRVVVKPGVACGACRACRRGDDDACAMLRIVGLHRDGGWAEYVAVPVTNLFRIPDGIAAATASAFSHSFPVAEQVLRRCDPVDDADAVLVIGGAGGVGSAAVQLAVQRGCRVLATASTAEKAHAVRALGAVPVRVDRQEGSLREEVRAIVPEGVDVVIDTAADPVVWRALPSIVAPLARIGVCGTHAGGPVDLDLRWLYRMRGRIAGSAGAGVVAYRHALGLLATGAIEPLIHSVHPLADFEEALALLRRRDRAGKVLLAVSDRPGSHGADRTIGGIDA